jgi:hypothetical protein
MSDPLEAVPHDVRRRIVEVHPDASSLMERLTTHPTTPTKIVGASTHGGRTIVLIDLNGRPHRLTLERIRD